MYVVFDSTSNVYQAIKIDDIFNSQGANAIIYHVTDSNINWVTQKNNTSWIAKIYREMPDNAGKKTQEKLDYMIQMKSTVWHQPYAWPEYLLYQNIDDNNKILAGYLMKKKEGKTIKSLLTNETNLDFKQKLHLCVSLTDALYKVHDNNLSIGDIHPGNILAHTVNSEQYAINFIDCDSYAIFDTNDEVLFHPSHMPTECYILNPRANNIVQYMQNDNHAVAVMLFQLLVNAHPYNYRSSTSDHFFLRDNRIFPCNGNNRRYQAYEQTIEIFRKLPACLRKLFIQSFTGEAQNIPKAKEYRDCIFYLLERYHTISSDLLNDM